MTKKQRLRRELETSIIYLGEHGFHGRTIAQKLGCSDGTVYHVCYKSGVKLRDYRDGKNEVAERIIARTPAIQRHRVKTLRRELDLQYTTH